MAINVWSSFQKGTSSRSTSDDNLYGGFRWKIVSQNIALNQSTVEIQQVVYIRNPYSWDFDLETSYYEYDGGNRYNISTKYDIRNGSAGQYLYPTTSTSSPYFYCNVASRTFTVTHNPDGTRTLSLKTYLASDNGGSVGNWTTTRTVTLDTIPRGSVIGTISSFDLEDSFRVPVTKYSSSFTDTLTIKYGSTSIKTIVGYTNNATITLSDSELLTAYNAMGSSMSGSFTFQITTKSGGSTIGTASKTATGTAAGTMHVRDGGSWRRAVPHFKVGGTWKKCIAYRKDGGSWHRGIG